MGEFVSLVYFGPFGQCVPGDGGGALRVQDRGFCAHLGKNTC